MGSLLGIKLMRKKKDDFMLCVKKNEEKEEIRRLRERGREGERERERETQRRRQRNRERQLTHPPCNTEAEIIGSIGVSYTNCK